MKIGITCYPTYGGSGVVATELGLELAQRGHEVHFISYSQPIRLTEPMPNIHYHEVEVSRYPLFEYPPYDLALATRMAEVAEIYDLDLLHVHYAIPHSVSAMLARQMLACDHRRHGAQAAVRHHTARHRHHAGRRRSVVSADYALLHRPERRRHLDFEVSEGANCRSLRCADANPGDSQLRELRSLPPHAGGHEASLRVRRADEKILVHLSNFRPVKRLPDVIEIFDRVQKKIPARLLMIGDGPERSRAEWLAVKKGIQQQGRLPRQAGPHSREAAVADVMLLPSELESFGLAALEAMACEVVPIATNVGGVPEVIDHGKTGFLANVGDVETMARYAIEILSRRHEAERDG